MKQLFLIPLFLVLASCATSNCYNYVGYEREQCISRTRAANAGEKASDASLENRSGENIPATPLTPPPPSF